MRFKNFSIRFPPCQRGGFSFWTDKGPFSFLLMAPSSIISGPIGTSISPKEKENGKDLARKVLKLINKKTHILARDREPKHPAGEENNIEILGDSSKIGLKEETHQVLIEPHKGTSKRCNQEKTGGRGRRIDRTREMLTNQLLDLQTWTKIRIRETCH